jgi:hypothetical protein
VRTKLKLSWVFARALPGNYSAVDLLDQKSDFSFSEINWHALLNF